MRISRRSLLLGASGLALCSLVGLAGAQAQSQAELMQAGPLGEQALGDPKAPVTMIEYASMTCPHCAQFHATTFPKLKEKYVDTGKVYFIFREFPLEKVAAGAFVLARCAGKDQFFPMVDLLFETQRKWAVTRPLGPMFSVLKQTGFTKEKFDGCLKNQELLDGIDWVKTRGEKFKIRSTPSFFINGKLHPGALTIEQIDKLIAPLI